MRVDNRRLLAAVAVAAVVVVAGVAVALTRSSNTTSSADLLPTGGGPPALTTTVFAPSGLGASIILPASWKSIPPESGFQYVIQGNGAFVGASRETGFIPLSASSLASARSRLLRSHGATIISQSIGTVDGRSAAKLQYRLPGASTTVNDTEYDIITTSTLPVGKSQNQHEYAAIVIVLGATPASTQQSTLEWIASTIRIAG